MKTSQTFWNQKNVKVEIWFEEINGSFSFWKKEGGISYSITERQYQSLVKKHNLHNLLVEYK